jgi:hypothetical protein
MYVDSYTRQVLYLSPSFRRILTFIFLFEEDLTFKRSHGFYGMTLLKPCRELVCFLNLYPPVTPSPSTHIEAVRLIGQSWL